jgi:hypothetical protein
VINQCVVPRALVRLSVMSGSPPKPIAIPTRVEVNGQPYHQDDPDSHFTNSPDSSANEDLELQFKANRSHSLKRAVSAPPENSDRPGGRSNSLPSIPPPIGAGGAGSMSNLHASTPPSMARTALNAGHHSEPSEKPEQTVDTLLSFLRRGSTACKEVSDFISNVAAVEETYGKTLTKTKQFGSVINPANAHTTTAKSMLQRLQRLETLFKQTGNKHVELSHTIMKDIFPMITHFGGTLSERVNKVSFSWILKSWVLLKFFAFQLADRSNKAIRRWRQAEAAYAKVMSARLICH